MSETVKDCRMPWYWLMVTADGSAKPCCWSTGTIGNVNVSSVDEVWNGETMVALREAIARDEVHPVCQGAPCKFVENMRKAS